MTELLEELRPRGFGIAYRMLGSASDAEDIVQEGLVRLHRALAQGEPIASPQAYLATVVTRLAIDELRSARVRRESYVGEWIPEPLETATSVEPPDRAELAESLELAFLILLERLSPEQRAVFLLRDVFDYGYDEIARMLDRSEPACRQLAVRARARVLERRPRFAVPRAARQALADGFFRAVQEGDLSALEALLAADVSLHGDGGGKAPALARPLHGWERVAQALLAWVRAGSRAGGFRLRRTELNGQPGAIFFTPEGTVFSAMTLEVTGERITTIRAVVNPDKLRRFGTPADMVAYLRRSRAAPDAGTGGGLGAR